ncbi:hypothetical protein [Streptomyces coelicoflavus]|uniref:hypothetical protein n=1 Tax=Streptomyces coelicoflavus TaxID=285562 RepID=UPI002E26C41F
MTKALISSPWRASAWPYDPFKVPDGDSAYELTQRLEEIPSSDRNRLRSTAVTTTWSFRSHREPDVYSRGLPILFPRYDVPVDAINTLPEKSGIEVGLSVEGHAGYAPGAITAASLSYSYDDSDTWTQARPSSATASGPPSSTAPAPPASRS